MKNYVGKTYRVRLRLYDENDLPRIGTGVYCSITPPRGAKITIPATRITNTEPGTYAFLYNPVEHGNYLFVWYETIGGVSTLADKESLSMAK